MAYAQWVTIKISPNNFDVTIKDMNLDWGKCYDNKQFGVAGGSKDNEIDPDEYNGVVVKAGTTFAINSCGRESASSGTQGSFSLYDGDTKVGSYKWDCPWGSKTNTSVWNPASANCITQLNGGNLDSGALGDVEILTVKLS